MGSGKKVGAAVLLIAVIGACVWWVVRSMAPEAAPKPVLGWKCSKCGESFDADLVEDAEAAYSETDSFPKLACPKCQGEAYRLVSYRCTKCKAEFELTLGPDPATGKPPTFACPKCRDKRIAPLDAK
ncbi:hypothetical protein ACFL09_01175 [Planctomycetota bacterium]